MSKVGRENYLLISGYEFDYFTYLPECSSMGDQSEQGKAQRWLEVSPFKRSRLRPMLSTFEIPIL